MATAERTTVLGEKITIDLIGPSDYTSNAQDAKTFVKPAGSRFLCDLSNHIRRAGWPFHPS